MKIALASDHAGFSEKEKLKALLNDLGLEVSDLGTVSEASVDYPDYARKVAEEVGRGASRSGCACLRLGNGHGDYRQQSSGRARGRGLVRRNGAAGAAAQRCKRAGNRRPHHSAG